MQGLPANPRRVTGPWISRWSSACSRPVLPVAQYPPEFIYREVWSGIDLERPGLTQLRNLARSGKLQVLYVFSADRLSRDLGDLLMVMREFEEYGVRVEFVQGGREDLDKVRLMMS